MAGNGRQGSATLDAAAPGDIVVAILRAGCVMRWGIAVLKRGGRPDCGTCGSRSLTAARYVPTYCRPSEIIRQ